ncbi:MAG: response regulator [Bacillota bacterium]
MLENNKVLFVDDEVPILNAIRRGLYDEEYQCFFANSGEEALKIMEKEDIHVIVTDMRMPGMDGLKLLKIVSEQNPEIVKIVLTGYTQLPQILSTINQVDTFKFLTKPWEMEEEFKSIIRQAIEYYNLKMESKRFKETLEKRNNLYQNSLKVIEGTVEALKKDFQNIKKSYQTMTELLNIGDSNEQFMEELSVFQEIYLRYLETLPSKNTDFQIDRFIELITKSLAAQPCSYSININKEDTTSTYYGNYKLLQSVFEFLFKSLSLYHAKKEIEVAFACKNKKIGLSLILKPLDSKREEEDTDASRQHHETFKKICSYLSEIIMPINGNIEYTEQDETIIIRSIIDFSI